MMYIREHMTPVDATVKIAVVFIRPWLVMLALGGLGHRLGYSVLYQNYWTVWLFCFVVRLLVGHTQIDKWVAGENLKEVKEKAGKL
jgi:hypothetical protein